jgi:hypothetical protein
MMNSILPILMLCLEGNYICERGNTISPVRYYEQGKACYIEGVFHTSCPPIAEELKAPKRKPWE